MNLSLELFSLRNVNMATPSKCITCSNNPMDLSGTVQMNKINKIISDDITVILISIFIIIILGIIIWYFAGQLIAAIKRWRGAYARNNTDIKKVSDDKEVYDEDMADTTVQVNPMKEDFLRTMENAYEDYNKLKTEYIASNYSKANDDLIDKSVFYKKYDDYDYKI